MLKQGYGKIINTASMASLLVPHPQKQANSYSQSSMIMFLYILGSLLVLTP